MYVVVAESIGNCETAARLIREGRPRVTEKVGNWVAAPSLNAE